MSTDAQLKGDSLRRQTELSKRYAEEHGMELVTDLDLHDIGVSAFKGDNAATGALSRFLGAVNSGKVPKGSYLLVESLDRLSRDKITAAMQLFLGITEKGVNIVTLSDGQVYHAGQTDFPQLVYSMAIMSRANDESRTKSQRVGAAWKNKRDRAGEHKLTAMAPKWLVLSEDRKAFQLIEERAEIVQRIFRLAEDGHGMYSITQLLNRDGVPAFGRSNGWNESYVEKILKNRAVLGEYQPHAMVNGKRQPVGDPVLDYFPRVITEEQFLAVQAARRKRATSGGGRKGSQLKNLFTHVATCAYCGSPMRMVDKGSGPKGGRYLKCSAGVRGMGCTKKGWRYEDFERSFLYLAREIDLAGVLNAEAIGKQAAELDQRIAAAEEKLRRLELQRERFAEMVADPSVGVDFIREKLAATHSEMGALSGMLDDLRTDRASLTRPPAEAEDIRRLLDGLNAFSGPAAYEQRSRVAGRIRSIVDNLSVAVEGDRPDLSKVSKVFEESGADPAYRERVVEHIHALNVSEQRYNPTFKVTFVGGITRTATVTTADPTRYVRESYGFPDGNRSIMVFGSSG